jgi:hypothetical protein
MGWPQPNFTNDLERLSCRYVSSVELLRFFIFIGLVSLDCLACLVCLDCLVCLVSLDCLACRVQLCRFSTGLLPKEMPAPQLSLFYY